MASSSTATIPTPPVLVAWVGEKGIRLYAHGRGGTFSARRLLVQARRATHDDERLAVAYRMYGKRFPESEARSNPEKAGG